MSEPSVNENLDGAVMAYLGQHPTAVSPGTIEYSTSQSDEPPAVAEQALTYPEGQASPGL